MSCLVCCLRISKSGTNQSPRSDNLNPENCPRGQQWFTHTAYWKNSDTWTNIASLFLQLPFPLSESSFLIWGGICEGEGCLWEVWCHIQGTGIFPPKTFCVETLRGGICPCGEGSKVLVEMLVKMREVTGRKGDGWFPLTGALPTLLWGGSASLSLCYHSMGERERRRASPWRGDCRTKMGPKLLLCLDACRLSPTWTYGAPGVSASPDEAWSRCGGGAPPSLSRAGGTDHPPTAHILDPRKVALDACRESWELSQPRKMTWQFFLFLFATLTEKWACRERGERQAWSILHKVNWK